MFSEARMSTKTWSSNAPCPSDQMDGIEGKNDAEEGDPRSAEEGDRQQQPPREGEGEESLKPRRSQAKRQWSIQAVKGKVTTQCLWNACKALIFGTLLILAGAAMATVGYYAEEEHRWSSSNDSSLGEKISLHIAITPSPHWPPPPHLHERSKVLMPQNEGNVSINGSATGSKRLSSGGFGLSKLSYVGPIVMGIGGFVIVAACVMTFEARDSAAKIVPARLRKTFPEHPSNRDSGVRHSSSQTKWEPIAVCEDEIYPHHRREMSRRAMTSAFIKFSKTLQSSIDSTAEYYERKGHRLLVKCPSAPSLERDIQHDEKRVIEAPRILRVSVPRPTVRRLSSSVLPRQAMSVDNPAIREVYPYAAFITAQGDEDMDLGASATGVHQSDSDPSLALDLHLPQCAVTLSVRDRSRSPSGGRLEPEETITVYPLTETDEAVAGPSGLCPRVLSFKVDKQTSTADYIYIGMLGHSRDSDSLREMSSSRIATGGSFREVHRPRISRRVRRSETMDPTTSARHRNHLRASHGVIRIGSERCTVPNQDHRRLAATRSEMPQRRHQGYRHYTLDNKRGVSPDISMRRSHKL